uniref:Kinesin motor domain-containing protein n=1 Tax=Romanomermis culicivorax TaxID=13658 RepID=A0A915IUA0_ROMCU
MNFYFHPVSRRGRQIKINEDEFFVFRPASTRRKPPMALPPPENDDEPLQRRIVQMSNPSKVGYMVVTSSTKKGHLKTPKPTPVVGIRGSGRKTLSNSTTDGGSITVPDKSCPTVISTPTNFARFLKDYSLPIPPVLYEPVSRKEPLNRIKIMLRVVPMGQTTSSKKSEYDYLSVDQKRKQVSIVENFGLLQPRLSGASKIAPKIFTFDHVFSTDDCSKWIRERKKLSQLVCFHLIADNFQNFKKIEKSAKFKDQICNQTLTDVIQTVLNGNDACVLSFGHAGSGENRTMIGSYQNRNSIGIIPCSISWLYRLVNDTKQKNEARFSIRVSAVEIFGPNEELRDLLATHQQASNPSKVCIKDDPISGTRLHNVNEVRAPSVEKAAYYFDAVLAERKASTEEERRNSHLFFTLHVYQYQVDKGGGAVAGGRTRLHLIDLGLGEKNSKAGRSSLTMPAIGNVLLTLLQGQKHLPFKDCKLAQLLKEIIGSQSCKSIAIIGNVSADNEKHVETINAVQIASRLQRLRRNHGRRIRMGIGGSNSSGNESSGDDRGPNGYLGRKKLNRSASDPDCAASGSEQSNVTVIFSPNNCDLVQSGVTHKKSAHEKSGSKASLGGGIFFAGSDWESTDVETVIAASSYAKNPKFHRAAPKPLPQPAMGVIRENLTASQSRIIISKKNQDGRHIKG